MALSSGRPLGRQAAEGWGSMGEQIPLCSREPSLPGPPARPLSAGRWWEAQDRTWPETLASQNPRSAGDPQEGPPLPARPQRPWEGQQLGPCVGHRRHVPPATSRAAGGTAPPTSSATQAGLRGSAVQGLPPAGHAPFRRFLGPRWGREAGMAQEAGAGRSRGGGLPLPGPPLLGRWTPKGAHDVSGTSPRKPALGCGAGGGGPAALHLLPDVRAMLAASAGGDRAPGPPGDLPAAPAPGPAPLSGHSAVSPLQPFWGRPPAQASDPKPCHPFVPFWVPGRPLSARAAARVGLALVPLPSPPDPL